MYDSLENGLSLEKHKLETGSLSYLPSPSIVGAGACIGAAVCGSVLGVAGPSIGKSFLSKIAGRSIFGVSQKNRFFSEKGNRVFEEITKIEKNIKDDDNYLPLVAMVSILFETEINTCLCERIRPIANELIDSTIKCRPKFNAEVLKAWACNKIETTIAVITMLLHGIRWAIEVDNSIIMSHLLALFDRKFIFVVSQKSFAHAVNEIRENYRNLVLHGRKTVFSRKEYNALSKLVIGEDLFIEWNLSPKQNFPTEYGILHDHILLAKNYP